MAKKNGRSGAGFANVGADQIRQRLVRKLMGRATEAFKEADVNWRGVRHILGWLEKDMEAFSAQRELAGQLLDRYGLKELDQIDERLRTLHYRISSALCLGADPAARFKDPYTFPVPRPRDVMARRTVDGFGQGLPHMEPDFAAAYEAFAPIYVKRFKLASQILRSTAVSISKAGERS
jgi:hypothetical protein